MSIKVYSHFRRDGLVPKVRYHSTDGQVRKPFELRRPYRAFDVDIYTSASHAYPFPQTPRLASSHPFASVSPFVVSLRVTKALSTPHYASIPLCLRPMTAPRVLVL